MLNDIAGRIEKQAAQANIMLRAPTLAENIDTRIADAEKQLAELRELKALLEKNPEFERMISLLGNGALRY